MGTRGTIARITKKGFKGRYHHWDSNPRSLGKTLYDLYNGFFNKDLKKMLKVLIDDHPAGWSTINDADFNLEAGFIESLDTKTSRPLCYCHGDRHEKAWLVTQDNASGSGCEWVYAFDEEKNLMEVLASMTRVEGRTVKMIGAWGMGDPKAKWVSVKTVSLDGQEPDWNEIEKIN